MASIAVPSSQPKGIAPDRFERFLAVAAIILLAVVLTAIGRGLVPYRKKSPFRDF
ncbi:hypothetical protein [Sphingobium yanoikuyae]|uniref:hypothetical protein n=1 Tax=Sphingobium yanoikuyae TaxID=13690 RepID=UPI0026F1133F|nr:hypothetical protein [Sphingobium yanoikuyae]